MIRLDPLTRWALRDFVRIARAKHNPRRTRLLGKAREVGGAMRAYVASAPGVEALPTAALDLNLRKDLLHSYNVETGPLLEIKEHLRRTCADHGCQYCGINPEADTFDHYLEKQKYPAYSVLYMNLIPSCASCNRQRKQTIQGARRAVLHFFKDPVDALPEILVVEKILAGAKGLNARFALRDLGPNASELERIYVRHFDSLHLRRRYASASGAELGEMLESVADAQTNSKRPAFDTGTAKAQLAGDAKRLRKLYGPNQWRVALRLGAVASDVFLQACEAKWLQKQNAL